jgi:hypothetical protein
LNFPAERNAWTSEVDAVKGSKAVAIGERTFWPTCPRLKVGRKDVEERRRCTAECMNCIVFIGGKDVECCRWCL